MSSHHSDDDEGDSLFGSPPPSPGRSPSPALALPGRSVNASGSNVSAFTKNVGTIALPGSQPNSELFLNPLASSLSLPTAAPRPPALSSRALNVETLPLPHHHRHYRTPSQPPTSDASLSHLNKSSQSKSPSATRPQSRKKKRKTSQTPRAQVQIPLPDPSEPVPANFLRSQTALLGAAGLVAGVKPANLVHKHVRGTSPSNPIVVDEEEPKHTRKSVPPTAQPPRVATLEMPRVPVDKSLLQMPSKQDILAALVKEKDVFPTIQGLIKITAPSPAQQQAPPPPQSPWVQDELEAANAKKGPRTEIIGTHATGYPMKKRKLNRVPAGAVDWDIPYPFACGEGPDAYHQTWKDERKKELIAQLIGLIKSATTKAAMINYYKKKAHRDGKGKGKADKGKAKETPDRSRSAEGPNINKYYKPITATYGLPPPPKASTPGSSSCVSSRQSTPAHDHHSTGSYPSRSLTPTSSALSEPAPSSAATTPGPESPNEDSNCLDLLLSSLMAMSQDQPSAGLVPQRQQQQQNLMSAQPSLGKVDGRASENDLSNLFSADQGWFDDWMKSLDGGATSTANNTSFPMDFGNLSSITSPQQQQQPAPSTGSSECFLPFGSIAIPSTTSSTTPTMGNLPAATDFDFLTFGFSTPTDPEMLGLSGAPSSTRVVSHDNAGAPPPTATTTSATAPQVAEWDMSILHNMFVAPPSLGSGDSVVHQTESLMNSGSLAAGQPQTGGMYSSLEGYDQSSVPDFWWMQGGPDPGPIFESALMAMAGEGGPGGGQAMCVDGAGPSVPSQADIIHTESTVASLQFAVESPSFSSASQPVEAQGTVALQQQSQQKQKSKLQLEKEEVIRRAKERRAVLEAELKKVKLQLWECTIEQGGLHHILGHYQEQARREG